MYMQYHRGRRLPLRRANPNGQLGKKEQLKSTESDQQIESLDQDMG